MKTGLAKRLFAASGAVVLSLTFSALPLARAYATSPYFKEVGGDTSSGGWFSDAAGASCTSSPNFQDNTYKSGDNSYGGIYTFAQNPGAGFEGASSQYGVFSLGQIDGGSAPNGFFSDATVAPVTPSTLSFANINGLNPPGYTGGLWGGTARNAAQCIPDYYDSKQPKPANTTALGAAPLSTNVSGTVAYTAGAGANPSFTLLSGITTIAAKADISVFVDGNVYINHNITYAGHNTTNTPRFALVAKGSIYIDPAVSQLDGLYIAQPDPATVNTAGAANADSGMVWTCHDGTTSLPTGPYVIANCQNNLTFNGAVIAMQVNLLRLAGDVGDNNANPAERFIYTPEMIIGGPFFPTDSQITNTGTGQPVFQSILSLPPIL